MSRPVSQLTGELQEKYTKSLRVRYTEALQRWILSNDDLDRELLDHIRYEVACVRALGARLDGE